METVSVNLMVLGDAQGRSLSVMIRKQRVTLVSEKSVGAGRQRDLIALDETQAEWLIGQLHEKLADLRGVSPVEVKKATRSAKKDSE